MRSWGVKPLLALSMLEQNMNTEDGYLNLNGLSAKWIEALPSNQDVIMRMQERYGDMDSIFPPAVDFALAIGAVVWGTHSENRKNTKRAHAEAQTQREAAAQARRQQQPPPPPQQTQQAPPPPQPFPFPMQSGPGPQAGVAGAESFLAPREPISVSTLPPAQLQPRAASVTEGPAVPPPVQSSHLMAGMREIQQRRRAGGDIPPSRADLRQAMAKSAPLETVPVSKAATGAGRGRAPFVIGLPGVSK